MNVTEFVEQKPLKADNLDSDLLNFLQTFEISDEKMLRWIDSLDVSADIKSLLHKFSKTAVKTGNYVIKLGRKIIDLVYEMCRRFPETSFRIVFWGIVGALISAIPVVGAVLGPIVTPLAIAFGVVNGLTLDLEDGRLKATITETVDFFSPLMSWSVA